MRLLKLPFSRETVIPMLALTFASTASCVLVIARMTWSGNISHGFLFWNSFLAWLPLIFALQASAKCQETSGGRELFRLLRLAF